MYESQALLPGPHNLDPDDWPQLELADVSVVRLRRGARDELVDLFEVGEHGPFRVRGTLLPVHRKHKKIVRTNEVYNHTLTIPKVETYSVEVGDGGDPVIWVLGAAAWYRIAPSSEYEVRFRVLEEKARLWMWLRERYGRRGRNESWRDVVREYAKMPTVKTTRTAETQLRDHRRYLLLMMLKPEEEVAMWLRSCVFEHYRETCEGEVNEVRRFYGYDKKLTAKTTPPSTPIRLGDRVLPDAESEAEEESVGEEGDEEEDEEEDDSDEDGDTSSETEEHTPSRRIDAGYGKTVSSKGRSILRPRRSNIPLDPPSPESTLLDSPLETRKRKQDLEILPVGSQLKRQLMGDEIWTPPPRQSRDGDDARPASRRIETQSPAQKDDTVWRCTLGCDLVVSNAKTKDGRHAIEMHYGFHGEKVERALSTVGEIEEAGGYQVGHLLLKIREMRGKWEEGKPSPLKGLGE